MRKLKLLLPLFLVAALGFATQANAINGKFIRDDNLLIKDNAYIRF